MGTFLISFTALLICALLIGWWYRSHARRRRLPSCMPLAMPSPASFLSKNAARWKSTLKVSTTPDRCRHRGKRCPAALSLTQQSDTVFTVTRAITRYGITTDDPNKWRYFLDSVEVHLPPFWEQYINDENSVELIPTDSLPLVIALNGHALSDYPQESRGYALERASSTQASIRGEESEQIELLSIRRKRLRNTR